MSAVYWDVLMVAHSATMKAVSSETPMVEWRVAALESRKVAAKE